MIKNQKGFSLIEITIVVVLLGLCLLAVAGFALRFQIAEFAHSQKAETADREKIISAFLKKDMENAGLNLTAGEQTPASGQVPPEFIENGNYEVRVDGLAATVVRIAGYDSRPLDSVWNLGRGSGEYSFYQAVESREALTGWKSATSGETRAFRIIEGRYFGIVENDREVYTDSEEYLERGDRLSVSIDYTALAGECRTNYYLMRGEERRLLYQSNLACPQPGLQIFADLGVGDRLEGIELKGAWLTRIGTEGGSLPLLPLRAGERLISTVSVRSGNLAQEVTILPSSRETDAARTRSETTFSDTGPVEIVIEPERRAPFETGDYCLLIDGNNGRRRSVLGIILEVRNGNSTEIIFSPAVGRNPAWGEYYSDTEDFFGSFPVGSKLVKLLAPVTYRLDANQDGSGLVLRRRSGVEEPWETVSFGLESFGVTHLSGLNQNTYLFNFSLTPEDNEGEGALPHEVKLTLSPIALNAK